MGLVKVLVLLVASAAALATTESLPDDCHAPKTVGPCRAAFRRWWYNATSQRCQKFIFGGCGGNANNFVSEQDCLQICVPAATESGHRQELDEDRPGFADFCAAPQVVGPCRASFPRWYFDVNTGQCKMFVYGGCRGNKNNYLFEEHCWSQCTGQRGRTEEAGSPETHPRLPSEPLGFSGRAVVLVALLAAAAALLLGSTVAFFVKICRKNQELSGGGIWSTLDDKELLMGNSYSL